MTPKEKAMKTLDYKNEACDEAGNGIDAWYDSDIQKAIDIALKEQEKEFEERKVTMCKNCRYKRLLPVTF